MARKTCRISVDIGNPDLYDAVKQLAAEKGATLKDVVNEALLDWVNKQEDLEDLADAEAALGQPTRPLEEVLKELGEDDLLDQYNSKR